MCITGHDDVYAQATFVTLGPEYDDYLQALYGPDGPNAVHDPDPIYPADFDAMHDQATLLCTGPDHCEAPTSTATTDLSSVREDGDRQSCDEGHLWHWSHVASKDDATYIGVPTIAAPPR